jgi:hypothetical protein
MARLLSAFWKQERKLLIGLGACVRHALAQEEGLQLEYIFLIAIFGTSFALPILYFCLCKGGYKSARRFIKEQSLYVCDFIKRAGFLCCTADGHAELGNIREDCCYRCCCCCRHGGKPRRKKKYKTLKGVDLRKIAVAPRPTSLSDGSSKVGTEFKRAQKIEKARQKAAVEGGYKKQYKVVERDSSGNQYLVKESSPSKKKKNHHHNHISSK